MYWSWGLLVKLMKSVVAVSPSDLGELLNIFILKTEVQKLCCKENVKNTSQWWLLNMWQSPKACIVPLQQFPCCFCHFMRLFCVRWFLFFFNFGRTLPNILSVTFTVYSLWNLYTASSALLNLGEDKKLLIRSFSFTRTKERHVMSA